MKRFLLNNPSEITEPSETLNEEVITSPYLNKSMSDAFKDRIVQRLNSTVHEKLLEKKEKNLDSVIKVKTADKNFPTEFLAELKNLNSQFSHFISMWISRDPCVDFSPVIGDYSKHLSVLKEKHSISTQIDTNPNDSTIKNTTAIKSEFRNPFSLIQNPKDRIKISAHENAHYPTDKITISSHENTNHPTDKITISSHENTNHPSDKITMGSHGNTNHPSDKITMGSHCNTYNPFDKIKISSHENTNKNIDNIIPSSDISTSIPRYESDKLLLTSVPLVSFKSDTQPNTGISPSSSCIPSKLLHHTPLSSGVNSNTRNSSNLQNPAFNKINDSKEIHFEPISYPMEFKSVSPFPIRPIGTPSSTADIGFSDYPKVLEPPINSEKIKKSNLAQLNVNFMSSNSPFKVPGFFLQSAAESSSAVEKKELYEPEKQTVIKNENLNLTFKVPSPPDVVTHDPQNEQECIENEDNQEKGDLAEEPDAFYRTRVKLLFKRGNTWIELGVGLLNLKKVCEDNGRVHMIVRVENSKAARVLMNVVITKMKTPVSKNGKAIILVSPPNPPIEAITNVSDDSIVTPVCYLIRLKAQDDTDELYSLLS